MHRARPSAAFAVGLALFCAALFAWSYIGFVVPFRAASGGRELLDARMAGYDASDVIGMLQYLRDHPDAAAIQRGLYLGPELILPAAVALLLIVLLRFVGVGGSVFGRPVPAIALAAIFFLPVLYVVVDYAEDIGVLMLFPPALPSDAMVSMLASVLPFLVRLKFAALAITVILLVRSLILRYLSGRGEQPR